MAMDWLILMVIPVIGGLRTRRVWLLYTGASVVKEDLMVVTEGSEAEVLPVVQVQAAVVTQGEEARHLDSLARTILAVVVAVHITPAQTRLTKAESTKDMAV